MATKVIRLRRDDRCGTCGTALPASTRARWDASTRTTTCLSCEAPGREGRGSPAALAGPRSRPAAGEAGASARGEYERRAKRRRDAIDRRWGSLAPVVELLAGEPQPVRAWREGSEGERRCAERLAELVGERAVLLHDRMVPRTRGNIDHLVIAPSGVWVVDAKRWKGRVERRDKGGWFTSDVRLYAGRRDRTSDVDGLGWQVRLAAALPPKAGRP